MATFTVRSQNKWLVFLLRLDVWLVAVTALYTYLVFFTDAVTKIPGGQPRGTFLGDFIGLFVPIGPNNLLSFLYVGISSLTGSGAVALIGIVRFAIAILVALFALLFGEMTLRRFLAEKPVQKIQANLAILMTLTLVIDLLTVGKWMSMKMLLYAMGGPSPF